jgi:ABC-type antimicrobial peptide transport system permease subunit
LVIRETLLLTLLGVLIGTGAAFASTGVLRSQLHGVGQFDPLTLLGVAMLLVCSALVASWAPARSAATIDPARALHQT